MRYYTIAFKMKGYNAKIHEVVIDVVYDEHFENGGPTEEEKRIFKELRKKAEYELEIKNKDIFDATREKRMVRIRAKRGGLLFIDPNSVEVLSLSTT